MSDVQHVAIVGAGFSGTLQAINLLRHDGPRATLIERSERPARGVAYATSYPDHLLNVRAANMSAVPDEPDHFVRWLAERGCGTATSFAPRQIYGDYLAEFLEDQAHAAGERLTLCQGEVVRAAPDANGVTLHFAGGDTLRTDAVVLALGNLPPVDPPALRGSTLPEDVYAADPWHGDVTAGLGDEDMVLIVGTGLTMVDVVLMLETRGFGGRVVALSRRGLAPRAHVPEAPPEPLRERPNGGASALVRAVRERTDEIGWRAAVDELRPFTQGMWLAASEEEQRRFLRHLRPWWDVHRHRIAPAVAERLAALVAAGRLEIHGGRLASAEAAGSGADVIWHPRGGGAPERRHVRRIVNCTGPQSDLTRTREPLLRQLLADGLIRPDAHRLGLDVTPQAETIAADGAVNPRLFALGPMTRGTFWEIVAVPDIRVQTWALARRLSHAHWVEGRGL